MANNRISGGEFGARMLSGLLDGLTQRYQQGQTQQREDTLYQTQLADKQAIDEQRFQRERELIGERQRVRTEADEAAKPSKLEEHMKIIDALDFKKKELQIEVDSEIEKARRYDELGIGPRGAAPKPIKPPKPYPLDRIKKDMMAYFPRNEDWIGIHSGDVAQYIAKALPVGQVPTLDDYNDASRVITGQNAVDTMFDRESPISSMMTEAKIKNKSEKFISTEDASSVLGPYGLLPDGGLPDMNWSVPELAHFIAASSPDPVGFMEQGGGYQQLAAAIGEILQDRMVEVGVEQKGPLKETAETLFKTYGGAGGIYGGGGGPVSLMMEDWIRRAFSKKY